MMKSNAYDQAETALQELLANNQAAIDVALAAAAQARAQGDARGECLGLLVAAIGSLRGRQNEQVAAWAARVHELLPAAAEDRLVHLAEHQAAQYQRNLGQPDAALVRLQALHEKAAQRPPMDAYLTAAALGIARTLKRDMLAALADFYDALAMATRSSSRSAEVNALNNLGSLQLDLHNLDDALPLLQRCLAGALHLGSHRQIIFAAGNLVQCQCSMGLAAEALVVARAHLIGRIHPEDDPMLHRDPEIAQVLLDNGQPEEAAAYLARAPQSKENTNEISALRSWLEARLLLARGDAPAALQRALAHQPEGEQDTNMPLALLRLAQVTANAAAACGQWQLAYEHSTVAYRILDQLLGRAAKARSASLKIQHQVQRTLEERDSARHLAAQLVAANAELQTQAAENAALQDLLQAQALEDPLTGLPNRRALFQTGPALLELARRQGQPVAAVVLDLDHFKQVNDRYGHEMGDQVLQGFADTLRATVRNSDLCCRYGGEEFVVLLVGSDESQAERRLQSLLRAFAARAWPVLGAPALQATFSAGISAAGAERLKLEELLRRADAALYAAKQGGRRQVRRWQEPPS
jgi:diguanylate cyclase (GGDEF)-like protein